MAVDVDASGHHHHAPGVDGLRARGYGGDDPAVLDADVLHHAVQAVGRVVHPAVDDAQRRSQGGLTSEGACYEAWAASMAAGREPVAAEQGPHPLTDRPVRICSSLG